jgi:2-hydroxy-4-carboxymuconate semialdehyde hemiacetal dehydrogenase
VAKKFGIPHWTGDLGESLKQPGLEAVILATPTQMHADQAVQCMRAGKHVQVEIPMADSLADSERISESAEGDRPHRHGRPHAPLQSQPSVDSQARFWPAN